MAGVLLRIFEKQGFSICHNWQLSKKQIFGYTKEFYSYSHPLFVLALFVFVIGIFDRWMLQVFGGSVEQGYYGLSCQIGAVCFLFTSAMTPLFIREFSIAFAHKDLPRMKMVFERIIPSLYSIAAYFACFIAIQADKVTYILGGPSFREATLVVTVMSFYPIHQTYGQLSGSVFLATGQTALFRNSSVIFVLVGCPMTVYFMAPANLLGLHAGAVGLAIKTVLLQFITVNVQLYFNCKMLHLNFGRYFAYQISSVATFLSLAFISSNIVNKIAFLDGKIIFNFIGSGLLYTVLVICLMLLFPLTFGLTRTDIVSFSRRLHLSSKW